MRFIIRILNLFRVGPRRTLRPKFGFRILDFDDLAFYSLSEIEDSKAGSVNKGTGGRTRVEEGYIFGLMIRRGMAVTVNNRVHFIEFPPDA